MRLPSGLTPVEAVILSGIGIIVMMLAIALIVDGTGSSERRMRQAQEFRARCLEAGGRIIPRRAPNPLKYEQIMEFEDCVR